MKLTANGWLYGLAAGLGLTAAVIIVSSEQEKSEEACNRAAAAAMCTNDPKCIMSFDSYYQFQKDALVCNVTTEKKKKENAQTS